MDERDGPWRCAEALSLRFTVLARGETLARGGTWSLGLKGHLAVSAGSTANGPLRGQSTTSPTTWLGAKLLATPVPSTPPTINITDNIERNFKTTYFQSSSTCFGNERANAIAGRCRRQADPRRASRHSSSFSPTPSLETPGVKQPPAKIKEGSRRANQTPSGPS